jgi:hypothetical protein
MSILAPGPVEKAILMVDSAETRIIIISASATANPLRAVLIVINHVFNGEYFNKYSAITNITIKDAFYRCRTVAFLHEGFNENGISFVRRIAGNGIQIVLLWN